MKLRIGLVQMVSEKADLRGNLLLTRRYLEEAAERQVDVLAYPEASLSGYADPAIHPGAAVNLDDSIVGELLDATRGLTLTALVGIIEANPDGKPFVTQLVLRDGALVGTYRKMTLPEDEDWYALGTGVPVFTHDDVTFGVAICADSGNEAVFAAAARQGAQIVFELAAPGLYGDQATRDWRSGFTWWEGDCLEHLGAHSRTYGIWTAVATQAGRTVDEDFPGGGYVFDPLGRRLFATPNWSPGAAYLTLDLDTRRVTEA